MAEDWFYHNSGQTFGPMSAKQLRQHALAGKITRSDHVRIGTEGSWASATKVKGLFEPPSTPIPMATAVPIPMATPVPIPTATAVPIPMATAVPIPMATAVPVPMATAVPVPMATATLGNAPSVTTEKLANSFDFNDKANETVESATTLN